MRDVLRTLRGAIGNAVVWGSTWFAGALAALGGANLLGGLAALPHPWQLVLFVSLNVGLTGFATGLAFSAYLRLTQFDRPLLSIRLGRTSFAAGVVAAASSVLLGALVQAAVGLPIGFDLSSRVPLVALLGAGTAGVTLHLAQRSARRLMSRAEAELEREQESAELLLGSEAG